MAPKALIRSPWEARYSHGSKTAAAPAATVTSETPLRAFTLDREGFERVVAESFTQGILKTAVERFGHH